MTAASRRPSKSRRALRIGGLVALVFAVALVAAYVFRRALFERSIAARLEQALAQGLGGTWRVDAVEGGWISDAAVSGVHLVAPGDDGRLRAFAVERVEAEFTTFGIAGGARSLTSLRVTGLTLELDLERPGATAPPSAPTSTRSFVDELPAALRALAVDGRADVRIAPDRRVTGRVAVRGDAHGIDVEFHDLAAPFGVEAPTWRARIDRPHPGRFELTSSDAIGGVELRRMSLDLAASPAQLAAEAAVAGGSIRADASGGRVRAEASQVDLARLPAWVARVAATELPAAGVVAAELDVAGDGAGTLHAHGRGVVVRGMPALDADATVDLARRPMYVSELTVSCAGVRVAARGLVVDPSDAWFVVEAAQASVETDDVAASLGAFGVDRRALDGEGPVRVRANFNRSSRGPLRVTDAEATGDGVRVVASGAVTLPARPQDWRDATLDVAAEVAADLESATSTRRFGADVAGRVDSTVRVDGPATRPRVTVDSTLRDARIEGRVVDLVRVRATLAGDAVDVAELTASSAAGSVRATGRVVVSTGELTTARIEADVPDVAALLAVDEVRGRVRGTATLRRAAGAGRPGTLAQWLEGVEGSFDATGERVEIRGVALSAVDAHASIRGRSVSVETLHAAADGVDARATFSADLVDATARDIVAAIRVDDPSRVVLALTGAKDVHGSGTVEIRAPALSSDLGALEGARVEVALRDVSVGASRVVAAKLDASVVARAVQFAASAGGAEATAAARGVVSRPDADLWVVHLDEATARVGDREVRLVAPAEVRAGHGRVAADGVELDVAGTRVRAHGSVGESIEVDVVAEGVDLARLVGGVRGRADVRTSLRGTADDAHLVVDAAFSDVSRAAGADGGLTGSLHVAATQDADGVRVTEATLDASPSVHATASLRLPWVVDGSGLRRVSQRAPEGSLTVRTDEATAWARRAGMRFVDAQSAEVSASFVDGTVRLDAIAPDVAWTPIGRPEFAVAGSLVLHAVADADSTTVSVDAAADTGSTVLGTFRLAAGIDWDYLSATFARASAAPIAGDVRVDVPDLSARRPRMPNLSPLAGRIVGAVTVGGTADAPTLRGVVDATDVAVGIRDDPRAFDEGSVRVSFENREIRIERVDGRLGFGPAHAEGVVRLLPDAAPVVDLRVRGENALIYQDDAMRLRADLDVAVKGAFDALEVSGDVRMRDSLFYVTLDSAGSAAPPSGDVMLFSMGDGPVGRAKLDLHVTADETVRIVGDRVRGAASMDLRLRGSAAAPEPEGRIECPGLRIFLPFSRVTLESGVVEFPHGRPFNPRLRAVAECRARGFDLTVRVTGDVPDVDVQITSIPAMTRDQAFVLLTTGASPDDVARSGAGGIAMQRAQFFVASEIFSQVGSPSDPTERGVLDRFSIEPKSGDSGARTASFDAWYEFSDALRLHLERDRYLDYVFGIVWRVRFR